MGRYDFVSPGAAVSGSIQGVATRQREEARQAALDAIAAQNAVASREATAQQIAASKQQMEANKVRSEGELLGQATPTMSMGQDISGADPHLLELMKKRAMTGPNPQEEPLAPGAEGPTGHTNYYKGTQEDQTRERKFKNVGKVIESIRSDSTMSELEKYVAIAQAMEADTLPAGAYAASQPQRPYQIWDEEKGSLYDAPLGTDGKPRLAPPGDNPILTRSRPPQPRQDPNPQYVGTDEKGRPIGWANGGAYTTDEAGKRVPYHGPMGAKPSASSGVRKPLVTEGGSQHLAALRAKATGIPGYFGRTTAPLPKDVTAYKEAANNILSSAKENAIDPSMPDGIRQILASNDKRSTMDIVESYRAAGTMTPEEFDEFTSLLYAVRGK